MPDALKEIYSPSVVNGLGKAVAKVDPAFDLPQFSRRVFDRSWKNRELKDRMHHISRHLYEGMSGTYPQKIKRLMKISPQFNGLPYLIFPDIVEIYGQNDWDVSIKALEHFTPMCSSEFAVRPFILKDPKRMINVMKSWSTHANEHVRRLASEGCRPRLPWAMGLPDFKRDPSPILPILEQLKTDDSEYVRRSVANNLNDISKDHPELALQLAARWLKQFPETRQLVKHACRTLLKQGNQKAMKLFGYDHQADVKIVQLKMDEPKIKIGGIIGFSFDITLSAPTPTMLRVEYAIDYVKLRGRYGRKVFKITERNFKGTETLSRRHRVHDMTTRVHNPGIHHLHVLINGTTRATTTFMLIR